MNSDDLREALDALRLLYDNQNGPPLPTHEESWREAMEISLEVLKKHGA